MLDGYPPNEWIRRGSVVSHSSTWSPEPRRSCAPFSSKAIGPADRSILVDLHSSRARLQMVVCWFPDIATVAPSFEQASPQTSCLSRPIVPSSRSVGFKVHAWTRPFPVAKKALSRLLERAAQRTAPLFARDRDALVLGVHDAEDPDRHVGARRHDRPVVAEERDVHRPPVRPLVRELPAGEVPEARRLVVSSGDGVAAVGRERDARHARGVPCQEPELLARGDVPEARGLVVRARERELPVGREGDDLDRGHVTPLGRPEDGREARERGLLEARTEVGDARRCRSRGRRRGRRRGRSRGRHGNDGRARPDGDESDDARGPDEEKDPEGASPGSGRLRLRERSERPGDLGRAPRPRGGVLLEEPRDELVERRGGRPARATGAQGACRRARSSRASSLAPRRVGAPRRG